MLKILLIQLLVLFLYAVTWFIVAIVKKRNDVADIAWGGGFICAALTAYLVQGLNEPRAILVFVLVVTWAIRLALHIGIRNRGKQEDPRYKAWREEWGEFFLVRTFLQIFLLQGFLLLIISLPVTWAITRNSPPFNMLDVIGVCIWLFGFLFEAIGIYEISLKKLRKLNKVTIIGLPFDGEIDILLLNNAINKLFIN